MSQIKDICKKYDKDTKEGEALLLREILENHLGYFPKFAQWVFTGQTSLGEVQNIIDLLQIVKINKPISEFETSEQLYDHIHQLQCKRKLNQIIKSIPSKSRKNISDRIKEAIYNNIEKENMFKDFFSKKGGTCKTEDDLYQRTMEIINSSNVKYSYKSVLNRIRRRLLLINLHYFFASIFNGNIFTIISHLFKKDERPNNKGGEIVYKDGKTIIVKINTFKTSVLLGSRHWCISRNLSYWNQYLNEDRTQYFIYQTEYEKSEKESMIGVTVHPVAGHIHASHYKNDIYCPPEDLKKYSKYLKGKEIPLKSIDDLVKYDIYDLDMLYTIPDWQNALHIIPNINKIIEENKNSYNRYAADYFRIPAPQTVLLNYRRRRGEKSRYSDQTYLYRLSLKIFDDIEDDIKHEDHISKYQDIHKEEYFIESLNKLEMTDPRLYLLSFYANEDKAFKYFTEKFESDKVNYLMQKLIFSKFVIHFKRAKDKLQFKNRYFHNSNDIDNLIRNDNDQRRLILNGEEYNKEDLRQILDKLIENNQWNETMIQPLLSTQTIEQEQDDANARAFVKQYVVDHQIGHYYGATHFDEHDRFPFHTIANNEKLKIEKNKIEDEDEFIFKPMINIIDSLSFLNESGEEQLNLMKKWGEFSSRKKLKMVRKFYELCEKNNCLGITRESGGNKSKLYLTDNYIW